MSTLPLTTPRRSLLLGLVAWAGSPAVAATARDRRPGPWIRLETHPCHGSCPVYVLTVSSDGHVRYQGQQFVILRGDQQRWLRAREVGKLRTAIEESGFSSLDSGCCGCREHTDHPWTVIQVVTDGVAKTIEHYHGCSTTPRTIPILEDEIVSIAGASRWIGTADQRSRRRWSHSDPEK